MQVGDQASVALQNADLDTFLTLSSSSLAAAASDLNTLANDLMGVTLPSLTTQEINNFLNNVKLHGFSGLPQQEQALSNLFGLSSTDQQNVVNEVLPANPANVPSSLVSALQQQATALQGLASVYGGMSPEADTTIPAVAVEGSMYNAVGSAAEITKLVTLFLPAQVANAIQNGLNPQVYASEALGLVFAFGDENGGMAFASKFGPANAAMPATPVTPHSQRRPPARSSARQRLRTLPPPFKHLSPTGRPFTPAMDFPVSRTRLPLKSISPPAAPHGGMRSVWSWPTISVP
jgi:hypothetical protein